VLKASARQGCEKRTYMPLIFWREIFVLFCIDNCRLLPKWEHAMLECVVSRLFNAEQDAWWHVADSSREGEDGIFCRFLRVMCVYSTNTANVCVNFWLVVEMIMNSRFFWLFLHGPGVFCSPVIRVVTWVGDVIYNVVACEITSSSSRVDSVIADIGEYHSKKCF